MVLACDKMEGLGGENTWSGGQEAILHTKDRYHEAISRSRAFNLSCM